MRARCAELLRETRGDPQALPTIPPNEWIKEAPADREGILPLLSHVARRRPSQVSFTEETTAEGQELACADAM